ncbi:hypothetical protein BD311DRAFT_236976 [Dichomitus squalens]|uniref:Uncharacterized protein n=1 Tax=Dichomitus squalens TaxID=114155 RepID=A0A4Q9M729_9APHY|nr:hypothetical protein BD311DRAFT_236976 [Dichomitus squalens]
MQSQCGMQAYVFISRLLYGNMRARLRRLLLPPRRRTSAALLSYLPPPHPVELPPASHASPSTARMMCGQCGFSCVSELCSGVVSINVAHLCLFLSSLTTHLPLHEW